MTVTDADGFGIIQIFYKIDEREFTEFVTIDIRNTNRIIRNIDIPRDLSIGNHTITFYGRDDDQKESENVTHEFAFKPSIPSISLVKDLPQSVERSLNPKVEFEVNIRDDDELYNMTLSCMIDNELLSTFVMDYSDTKVYSDFIVIPWNLSKGSHSLSFVAIDSDGNNSTNLNEPIMRSRNNNVIEISLKLTDNDGNSTVQIYYTFDESNYKYYDTFFLENNMSLCDIIFQKILCSSSKFYFFY